MKHALLICFVGLFAATLYVGLPAAQACSYGYGVHRSVIPADKATNIPPNVLISVSYSARISQDSFTTAKDELYLADASGNKVECAITLTKEWSIPSERVTFSIKPKQELAKKTEYFLYSQLSSSDCLSTQTPSQCKYGKHTVISSFTTGSESDNKAPTSPDGANISCGMDECKSDSCCGPYKRIRAVVSWKKATDNHFNEYLRYNVYDSEDTSKPIAVRVDAMNVYSFLGLSGETGSYPTPTVELPPSKKYIVRAVDIAGNEDGNTNKIGLPTDCEQASAAPPLTPGLVKAGCSTSGSTFHGDLLLYFAIFASLLWLRIK